MLKRNESEVMGINYAEYLTGVKCEGKWLVRKLLCIAVTVVLLLIGSWAVLGGIINAPPLELLVLGACGILFFFASGIYKVEYEYVVASAQIEFDAIYRQHRRREILTVSMDEVERIAPVNETNRQVLASQKPDKVYDFCSSKGSPRRYFMLVKKGAELTVIYFDAIPKTLEVMKFYRSGIVEMDNTICNPV